MTPRAGILVAAIVAVQGIATEQKPGARPGVAIRGIYGGVPQEILDSGRSLEAFGVNAVWLGSGSLTPERVSLLRSQGVRVFAEFNTLHVASYLKDHPDAAPVGADGWCPRRRTAGRVFAPRTKLTVAVAWPRFGISWSASKWMASGSTTTTATPVGSRLCPTCPTPASAIAACGGFRTRLASGCRRPTAARAALLLSMHRQRWTRWRMDVLTDWVREFRTILDVTRPAALLGTFHNPWSDEDFGGARLEKLAIDLRAQAAFIDVFSPMPYHARFGHAGEPQWISRQVAWLGRYLGIAGVAGEKHRIWPIVQISDWGEPVPLGQVDTVLDHGSRAPATGVMVFAWGGLRTHPEKVEAIGRRSALFEDRLRHRARREIRGYFCRHAPAELEVRP